MKKRPEITKIIKSVVATDFKNKIEARKAFNISSPMMTKVLGGYAPSPGALSYIGYERVDVYRSSITHNKTSTLQIISKVRVKCAEFNRVSDAADFFCCTPQHLRSILRGDRNPSRTMCTFAGVYKTDEYKKVK